MDGTLLKRLLRKPWLSLTGFLISGALCLLLCLLVVHMDRQKTHLEEIRGNYEIRVVVSDLRGTKTDRLFMSRRYTDFLKDEENGLGAYIRDLLLTKSFDLHATFGVGNAIGVSSELCASTLNPKAGGAWYAAVENFFECSERICLVSEVNYEKYAGQELMVNLKDSYALENGFGDFPFTVVGWYKGEGSDIYIPYPTSQDIAGHLAEAPSTDSASFTVKDNTKIDEMLAAAAGIFEQVDPSSTQTGSYALNVHDRQYKATIATMEQNIRRTAYLFPLLALMGLSVGFLLGVLGTRRETRTYALMRTLGVSGFGLFFSVLIEQMFMSVLAALLVGLVLLQPLPALIFLLCYLVGCIFAVIRPVTGSPTKLFREHE
jgi:hypothetical protein